jgi:hypothetical protein
LVVALLLMLLALGLAGCEPSDVRDIENTLSDSATLVAALPEAQPTKSARPSATVAAPTKKPTRTATKSAAPSATPSKRIKNTPGDFDFYVLTLSWSPDYCAASNVDDPQQCSLGKKLGFVLHGLWPQYNRGYPADCSNVPLPKDAQQKFPNLYPSPALYTHVGQAWHLLRPHIRGISGAGKDAERFDHDPAGLSQPGESVSHYHRSAQDGFRECQLRSEGRCAGRAVLWFGTLLEGTVCVLLARGSACGVQSGDSKRCGP